MSEAKNIRLKEKKTVIVPLQAINYLSAALLKFNTTCLADFRKINSLLEDLEKISGDQVRPSILEFYEKHELPKEEQISQTHPLFSKFIELQNGLSVEITKMKLQVFTETELDGYINGKEFSFMEMKALDEFVVKK